jgi:adenylate kinase
VSGVVQVIVLLGPPGSGKGTQAKKLQEINPSWLHISTGDLFRKEIASGSDLGRSVKEIIAAGKLVSDNVTDSVFQSQVNQLLKTFNPEALILDGYPRTAAQGRALILFCGASDRLGTPIPLELMVPEQTLVQRLSDRLVNPRNGRVYHKVSNPPKKAGICDDDGQPLVQRPDDRPEVIRDRYRLYVQERDGIVGALLPDPSALVQLDGVGDPKDVSKRLTTAISQLTKA